jgi:glycosyltransferase involved in cell wall biosynthesis
LTRVLFLTESFHPVLGGGETHIRLLGSRLAASGTAVTVLTRRTEPAWPEQELLQGVRVLRVGPTGWGRSGKYQMVAPAVAALLRERRGFDVLVVRGTRVLGLPGLLAARALGKRVVFQAEVNGELSGEVYSWGTRLAASPMLRRGIGGLVAVRNPLMRDADAFVAMSRRIREEALVAGVPEGRVELIPHGVDTRRFRLALPEERLAARRRLGLPQEGELVLYSGRLLRGKGLETLLEAFARVAGSHPDARLVLVGSGEGQALSVEAALRARAEQPPLAGRVVFTGKVEAVEEYLRACDVFAFPSLFEALGIALIEAAASGLPCVGSRTGGIPDVIEDGESGLLVAPGSAEELAGALDALLANPSRRSALGRRARAIAETRFDFEDSLARYRALFDRLGRTG